MTYPIDTRVLIDGIEAYDRASDLAEGRMTVLDQLELSWGRSSAVDQPEVGECRFQLREQLQEPQPERVLARNLAPDPSFEYGTGGFTSGANGTVEIDTTRSRTGQQSIRLTTTGTGIHNPVISVYGPNVANNPEPRLKAGDEITAQIWTYVPDLLPPISEWGGGPAVNGSTEIITDPTAPERQDLVAEWTAARDQVNNSALVTSTNAPATDASTLAGSVWFKKGNPGAPGLLRLLILCYDASGAYLGVATGGTFNGIPIGIDEWTPFTFSGVQPLPGTAHVRMGIYPDLVNQDPYSTGDKIRIVAPELIPQGDPRPQIRIGGSRITGTNTPDFVGPYNVWTPLTLTRTINEDDSTVLLYLYGSNFPGRRVWFDDLAITVNAGPVHITGDTYQGTAADDRATTSLTGVRDFPHQPDRDYEGWPEITATPSGAWLLTYNSSTGHVLPATAVVQRSEDQGRTWQQIRTFGAEGEDWGGGQSCVLDDGSMVLFSSYNTTLDQQSAVDARVLFRSTDDGLTWTERTRVADGRSGPMGELLQLRNGDLYAAHHGQGWGHYRSTDRGLTWTYHSNANGGPWMTEARIVQCPDGSLVAIGRNGRLLYFRSTDNGYTWTRGVDTHTTDGHIAVGGNVSTEAIWLTDHLLEMVWISRTSRAMFYTRADVRDLVDDPTAWSPSVRVAAVDAARSGDQGYPAMIRRTDGDFHVVWYADPDGEFTPSIYEGILSVQVDTGPGPQYRWLGAPGQSVSEQFLPPSSQTPVLDRLHTGSSVAVWARAGLEAPPPDDDQVMTRTQFLDPGLLSRPHWNSDTARVVADVANRFGRQAVWIDRGTDPWAAQVVFPPDTYPPEGRQPDAWDNIPRLLPGQTWQLTVTALLPPGGRAQLAAWAVDDPHRSATGEQCIITGEQVNQLAQIPGDHQWHTITATVELPVGAGAAGAWIVPGVQINELPSPKVWADMPGSWWDNARSWADWTRVGVSEIRLHQTASSARDVLVWSGRLTALTAQAAGDRAVAIAASAVDPSAPLANETIGDTPWPVHTVGTRVSRIMRRARFDYYTAIVDPSVASVRMSARDVDAQPVLGLLHDAANSVGGVLWVAEHATMGTYLWLEDPAQRTAVREFVIVAGQLTITGITGAAAGGGAVLSAADILRDPISLTQDTTSVVTSVDVGWREQTVDDEGEPAVEDHTITRTDDTAVDQYGMQKLQVDTELITDADAADLADRHLARARAAGWEFTGVTLDGRVMERPNEDVDEPTRLNTMIDMLDGTRRLGLPITLLDLPDWMRAGRIASGYLEGGTYTLNNGRWDLDLTVAAAATQGESASWEQIPTSIGWTDVHADVSWADAYGVAPPTID